MVFQATRWEEITKGLQTENRLSTVPGKPGVGGVLEAKAVSPEGGSDRMGPPLMVKERRGVVTGLNSRKVFGVLVNGNRCAVAGMED